MKLNVKLTKNIPANGWVWFGAVFVLILLTWWLPIAEDDYKLGVTSVGGWLFMFFYSVVWQTFIDPKLLLSAEFLLPTCLLFTYVVCGWLLHLFVMFIFRNKLRNVKTSIPSVMVQPLPDAEKTGSSGQK